MSSSSMLKIQCEQCDNHVFVKSKNEATGMLHVANFAATVMDDLKDGDLKEVAFEEDLDFDTPECFFKFLKKHFPRFLRDYALIYTAEKASPETEKPNKK
jgi:DNA-directed RNA polymerase subunit RPC12/RpoP